MSESTEVCKRCGMTGPHLWPSGCIDRLREEIRKLDMDNATLRSQRMKEARPRTHVEGRSRGEQAIVPQ